MCKDAAKKMPPQNSNVDFCEKKKRRRERYTVRDDVAILFKKELGKNRGFSSFFLKNRFDFTDYT